MSAGDAVSPSVAEALRRAAVCGVDRLDAQRLLAAALARPRGWLIAHDDARLDAATQARYADWLARCAAGEPVAYLLGAQEFYGLPLAVSPAVLVPRPDTETLVDWALELLPPEAAVAVADLGTGSGAIALALASQRPACRITAVDASAEALAVARGNGQRLGHAVEWLLSDWFGALAGRSFALVAANPPYIAEGDPHLPALRHEPQQALTSGADGLDAIRHIAAAAPAHLHDGGWLLFEHGFDQADAVRAILAQAGFEAAATRADLAGRPRCSGGRRRSGA